jgi:hypothetical protein
MGAREPVPYSVDRIRLVGNFRRSVHGRRAPALRATAEPVGLPPRSLGPEERRLWRQVIDDADWLTRLDRPLLFAYVTGVLRHQRMVAELGQADDAALDVQQLRVRRAFLNMLEASRALALPPAARLRLASELPDDLDAGEFGSFTVIKGGRT